MTEYTPTEAQVREQYVGDRRAAYAPEFAAEFDRFLARVRRDAARGALDGLVDEAIHVNWEMDGPSFALRVRRFKTRNHPEETP